MPSQLACCADLKQFETSVQPCPVVIHALFPETSAVVIPIPKKLRENQCCAAVVRYSIMRNGLRILSHTELMGSGARFGPG